MVSFKLLFKASTVPDKVTQYPQSVSEVICGDSYLQVDSPLRSAKGCARLNCLKWGSCLRFSASTVWLVVMAIFVGVVPINCELPEHRPRQSYQQCALSS